MIKSYGSKDKTLKLKEIFCGQNIEIKKKNTYGYVYKFKWLWVVSVAIDKALLVITKGLYAFVPFSFLVFGNKMPIILIREKKLKYAGLFRVKTSIKVRKSRLTLLKIKFAKWKKNLLSKRKNC